MTVTALAAIATAGTALVLAPIDPQTIREVLTDLDAANATPAPQPRVFDAALTARVRSALGLRHWTPVTEHGETETRIVMWSQLELNAVYERVGGTVTSRQAERTDSCGDTWTATEITVTTDLPGAGRVEMVTDWYGEYVGDDLPVMRALTAPQPEVLETVPARPGYGIGYYRRVTVGDARLIEPAAVREQRDLAMWRAHYARHPFTRPAEPEWITCISPSA